MEWAPEGAPERVLSERAAAELTLELARELAVVLVLERALERELERAAWIPRLGTWPVQAWRAPSIANSHRPLTARVGCGRRRVSAGPEDGNALRGFLRQHSLC